MKTRARIMVKIAPDMPAAPRATKPGGESSRLCELAPAATSLEITPVAGAE